MESLQVIGGDTINKRELDTNRATILMKIKKTEQKIEDKKKKIKDIEDEIKELEEKKEILKDKLIANEGHFHRDYSGYDE